MLEGQIASTVEGFKIETSSHSGCYSYDEMLVRMTWYQILNRRRNARKTEEHQQLPMSQLLNLFSVRVYNQFSGVIHRNQLEESKLAAETADIPSWKPKTFNYNQMWYANQITFVFSRQNITWDQISDCIQNYKSFGLFSTRNPNQSTCHMQSVAQM